MYDRKSHQKYIALHFNIFYAMKSKDISIQGKILYSKFLIVF